MPEQQGYNVSSLFVSIGLDTSPAERTLNQFENLLQSSVNRLIFTFTEDVSQRFARSFEGLGRGIGNSVQRGLNEAMGQTKRIEKEATESLANINKAAEKGLRDVATTTTAALGQVNQALKGLEANSKKTLENTQKEVKRQLDDIRNLAASSNLDQDKVIGAMASSLSRQLKAMDFSQIEGSLQAIQRKALDLGSTLEKQVGLIRNSLAQPAEELEKALNNSLKKTQEAVGIADKALEESGVKFAEKVGSAYKQASETFAKEGVGSAEKAINSLSKGVESAIKEYERAVESTANDLAKKAQQFQVLGTTVAMAEAERLYALANSVRSTSVNTIASVRESATQATQSISKEMGKAGGEAGSAFGGGFGAALGGVVGGPVGSLLGAAIAEALANGLQLALNSRMEVIKATLGGYMNTVARGMMNFAEEERRINMGLYVTGKREGFGQDSAEFNTKSKDVQRAVTLTASDLSYGRVEIAELFKQLVKSGFNYNEIIGGTTPEEMRRGALYQTAGLGEAVELPGDRLDETSILVKQFKMAFPENSIKTIVREIAALGLSTPAQFDRFKYATQDSLSAAAVAGIPMRDVMQGFATMFNLSTPEVAGTMLKTIYNGISGGNVNRQMYGVVSKYYQGEDGQGDLLTALRNPGDFAAEFARLDTVMDSILKKGEAVGIAGMENVTGDYYKSLGLQEQANMRARGVSNLFGGGDTFQIGYRNLTLEGREKAEEQKREFANFNNEKDGELLPDFIRLRQKGLKGAMELIESTKENVESFAAKLAPGFTQMVLFFNKVANELTAGMEKFSGPLERISEKLGEVFGNLSENKLIDKFVDGISSTMGNVGRIFENWLNSAIEFVSKGENVDTVFLNLNNLLSDFAGLMQNLAVAFKSFLPLINEATGALSKAGVESEVRQVSEELKIRGVGEVSERVFNYGSQVGNVEGIKITNSEALGTVSEEEAKQIAKSIKGKSSTATQSYIRTGRERSHAGMFGAVTAPESFADVDESTSVGLIQQGMKRVEANGRTYYITGGTGEGQSQFYELIDGDFRKATGTIDSDPKTRENLIETLMPREGNNPPPMDLSTAGMGSFLNPKKLAEIAKENGNLKNRQAATLEAQQSRVRDLFGNNAVFDEKTGKVREQDSEGNRADLSSGSFGTEALSKTPERLNALIRTGAGLEGSSAEQALRETASRSKITNLQTITGLSSGKTKGKEGEAFLLSQADVLETIRRNEKEGADIAKTASELTQDTTKELEEALRKKGQLKPAWDRIKKQIESGEIVGDSTTFLEQFITKAREKVSDNKTPFAERNAMNENLIALTKDLNTDKPKPLEKPGAVKEGVPADLEKYRRLIDDMNRSRIEQENQILQLRQKSLELERQSFVLATAFKGQVNANLEQFFGILSQAENTLLGNQTKLRQIDQFFVDRRNNLANQFKDVNPQVGGGIQDNYEGTGQPVFVPKASPDKNVNALSQDMVKGQLDVIKEKQNERAEIAKQNELIQRNLTQQIRNAVAQTFQQATNTATGLASSFGGNSEFMAKTTQLFDGVRTQGVQLAQQIQALKVIQQTNPSGFGAQDAKALSGLEGVFKQIPRMLKEALGDALASLLRQVNTFFQDLSERSRQRSNELMGMVMPGGASSGLLTIVGDLQNSLFKNQQESLELQQESSQIRRQVELNRSLGAVFPDQFFAQKVSMGEASIGVNDAKRGGLELEAKNLLETSKIKANITYFNSFIELFQGARGLSRGFSSVSDAVTEVEQRREAITKSIFDLETQIQLMESQLETMNSVFGSLSLVDRERLEEGKKYLEQQKQATIALQKINDALRGELGKLAIAKVQEDARGNAQSALMESNSARSQILGLSDSRSTRREAASIDLENSRIDAIKRVTEATLKSAEERANIVAELANMDSNAAKGMYNTPEAQAEIARKYVEYQSRLISIDNEVGNARVMAYNNLKVQVEKSALELDEGYRANVQIANTVDGAFSNLYDILTDSSKSFADRMKDFSQSLIKDFGRIGWEQLKDVIVSPFKDMLTKRDTSGILNPSMPDFSRVGANLNFQSAAMSNPDDPKSKEKLREQILAVDAQQQTALKELNERMRRQIVSSANIDDAGKAASTMYSTLAKEIANNTKDAELSKLISIGSANGQEGMATNIALQTSIQENIKNTLLQSQTTLKEILVKLSSNTIQNPTANPQYSSTANTQYPSNFGAEILPPPPNVKPGTKPQTGFQSNVLPAPPSVGQTPVKPKPKPKPVVNEQAVDYQMNNNPANAEFNRLFKERKRQGLTGGTLERTGKPEVPQPLKDEDTRRILDDQLRRGMFENKKNPTRRNLQNQLRSSTPNETLVSGLMGDMPVDWFGASTPTSNFQSLTNLQMGTGLDRLILDNLQTGSGLNPGNFLMGLGLQQGQGQGFGATPAFSLDNLDMLSVAPQQGGGGWLSKLLGGMGGMNWMSMGMMALPFIMSLFNSGKRKRYNSGGVVPGAGTTDTVPAMLTPGEGILTNAGMSRIGGEKNLYALNSGSLKMGAIQPPKNLGMPNLPTAEANKSKSAIPVPVKTEAEKTIAQYMGGNEEYSLPPIELSYTSTTIAGQNYVTEQMFKSAIEQSVERAKMEVFGTLKNSPNTRRKLGL
jgi:hypothetical protein